MKTALYLAPALAITVPLLIRAEIKEIRGQILILKPISTLLVIAAAALSFWEADWSPVYSMLILAGLVFSLGGDIALIFKDSGSFFKIGLVLFLIAHLLYTTAFISLGRMSWIDLPVGILLLAPAVGFYLLIQPNLGSMKVPVIAYILIISLMVSRAFSSLSGKEIQTQHAWLMISGAILFYISDLILASNRYWRSWKFNRISLAFYYFGQYLLALAASYFG